MTKKAKQPSISYIKNNIRKNNFCVLAKLLLTWPFAALPTLTLHSLILTILTRCPRVISTASFYSPSPNNLNHLVIFCKDEVIPVVLNENPTDRRFRA
jgi:hypothetical protein